MNEEKIVFYYLQAHVHPPQHGDPSTGWMCHCRFHGALQPENKRRGGIRGSRDALHSYVDISMEVDYAYELVQVERPKFRQPRMSNVTYMVSY